VQRTFILTRPIFFFFVDAANEMGGALFLAVEFAPPMADGERAVTFFITAATALFAPLANTNPDSLLR